MSEATVKKPIVLWESLLSDERYRVVLLPKAKVYREGGTPAFKWEAAAEVVKGQDAAGGHIWQPVQGHAWILRPFVALLAQEKGLQLQWNSADNKVSFLSEEGSVAEPALRIVHAMDRIEGEFTNDAKLDRILDQLTVVTEELVRVKTGGLEQRKYIDHIRERLDRVVNWVQKLDQKLSTHIGEEEGLAGIKEVGPPPEKTGPFGGLVLDEEDLEVVDEDLEGE